MKLPILYTLDSRGKIRVFECEIYTGLVTEIIDQSTFAGHDYPIITTRTGLLNGKLIEKKEIVSNGKQDRNLDKQAEFQAKSLWNEKLDEGYKSQDQLLQKAVDENVPYITIIEGDLREGGLLKLFRDFPQAAYTNSQWDELPMLAFKFKDIKNPEFPYYAQPKLNGVRCLVKNKGGEVGNIKLCSRGGQYYKIKHIEEALNLLYLQLIQYGIKDNIILDGEIYKHGIPLQDISGAARSEDNSMFASNNWLEYWIYDMINLDHLEYTQDGRTGALETIQKLVGLDNPHIKFVRTTTVNNKEQIKELHDRYISEGYEGLILRNPKGKYEFNQRSRNLLKVKQYEDAEFVIKGSAMNVTEPESFVFILGNDINNEIFKARPTGTLKQKEEWHHNIENYIGKKATVRFFERSKDGLPLQACVQSKLTPILIENIRPTDE